VIISAAVRSAPLALGTPGQQPQDLLVRATEDLPGEPFRQLAVGAAAGPASPLLPMIRGQAPMRCGGVLVQR